MRNTNKNFGKNNFFVLTVIIVILSVTIFPAINANNIVTLTKDLELNNNSEIKNYFNGNNSTQDLLIITPSKYKQLLMPLEEHKEKYNVKTFIATLDEVYDQIYWQGRDNPEKIKYYIKKAYDEWGITYVMLVGSFRDMPVRYVHNQELLKGYLEPTYISELYYADLYDSNGNFSSWDTDNDGVFGEWLDDNVSKEAEDRDIDLRPDVYIGRLACRNSFEVRIMVNKIINYETETYQKEWFKRFVVVAGDTYDNTAYLPYNTSGYEGEENTAKAIENMTDFEITRLWVSNGNFTGPKDVIRAFNKGCGLMFFDGHANPISWGTHEYNSSDFIDGLNNQHMWRLFNRDMMPIVVAGACHNAQFDVKPLNLLGNFITSFYHSTYALECWAWKLTSKPFGGSIATIGNTGLGMTKEDKESKEGAGDFMDVQFFYQYGFKNVSILGEAWGKSINRYLDYFPINWDEPAAFNSAYDAKTVQEWTLLGDPSLKIGGYPPLE